MKGYRLVMGERLKAFREDRGFSIEQVAQAGGISAEQVKKVENGETNYTIDEFLGYIKGNDLYMYFGEKTPGRAKPHDFEDMAKKGLENNPKRK